MLYGLQNPYLLPTMCPGFLSYGHVQYFDRLTLDNCFWLLYNLNQSNPQYQMLFVMFLDKNRWYAIQLGNLNF